MQQLKRPENCNNKKRHCTDLLFFASQWNAHLQVRVRTSSVSSHTAKDFLAPHSSLSLSTDSLILLCTLLEKNLRVCSPPQVFLLKAIINHLPFVSQLSAYFTNVFSLFCSGLRVQRGLVQIVARLCCPRFSSCKWFLLLVITTTPHFSRLNSTGSLFYKHTVTSNGQQRGWNEKRLLSEMQ